MPLAIWLAGHTMSHILNRAEAIASDVIHARTGRGLINAADAFKVFVSGIPDAGLQAITKSDLRQVSAIAAKIIDHVDAHIDASTDSHGTKLQCASLIYGIRAKLEDMARWSRHLPA